MIYGLCCGPSDIGLSVCFKTGQGASDELIEPAGLPGAASYKKSVHIRRVNQAGRVVWIDAAAVQHGNFAGLLFAELSGERFADYPVALCHIFHGGGDSVFSNGPYRSRPGETAGEKGREGRF